MSDEKLGTCAGFCACYKVPHYKRFCTGDNWQELGEQPAQGEPRNPQSECPENCEHCASVRAVEGMSAEQLCRQKFEESYPVTQYRDGPPLEVTKAIHYGHLKREWEAFQKGWQAKP